MVFCVGCSVDMHVQVAYGRGMCVHVNARACICVDGQGMAGKKPEDT